MKMTTVEKFICNEYSRNTIVYANIIRKQLVVFYKLLIIFSITHNYEKFSSFGRYFLDENMEFDDDKFDDQILKTFVGVFGGGVMGVKFNSSNEFGFNTKTLNQQIDAFLDNNSDIDFAFNNINNIERYNLIYLFHMVMKSMQGDIFEGRVLVDNLLENISSKLVWLLDNLDTRIMTFGINENSFSYSSPLFQKFTKIMDEKFLNLYKTLLSSISENRIESHLKVIENTKPSIKQIISK